jgi:hypothetical protein
MRVAIIVYSLTGNSLKVAQAVGDRLGVPLCRLLAPNVRMGPFAMVRLGMAALFHQTTPVSLDCPGLADCDAVILASPVWAGRVSVPMQSWLAHTPALPPCVGLILTGGAVAPAAALFNSFARLAKVAPVARLYAGEQALKRGEIAPLVTAFCAALPK